jgi:hypothetical protein
MSGAAASGAIRFGSAQLRLVNATQDARIALWWRVKAAA